MPLAKEGLREIALATLVLGALSVAAFAWFWPVAIPFVLIWIWVLAFFRDPKRSSGFAPGELCSPADGTITEISEIDHHDVLGGPAVRIGMFLSLFNVHVNRMPCSGIVRSLSYRAGEFLDARHPESGRRNECNAVLIDPDDGLPGPVEVRQIAGKVARRIVCNAAANERLAIGSKFGMIKFGSRTELIIPRLPDTVVAVGPGDRVRAGLTVLARQPVSAMRTEPASPPDRKGARDKNSSANRPVVSTPAGIRT